MGQWNTGEINHDLPNAVKLHSKELDNNNKIPNPKQGEFFIIVFPVYLKFSGPKIVKNYF